MADWSGIEVIVTGFNDDVNLFLESEFDGFELLDRTLRIQIDDIDEMSFNGESTVVIIGQQASDSGEMWVRELRLKYMQLDFEGRSQVWEDF